MSQEQTAALSFSPADWGPPPYAVVAHRWGLRDAHSYVVCVTNDAWDARAAAEETRQDRPAYGVEITDSTGKQLYYLETPNFGDAGRFCAASHPAKVSREAPWPLPDLKAKAQLAILEEIEAQAATASRELGGGPIAREINAHRLRGEHFHAALVRLRQQIADSEAAQ